MAVSAVLELGRNAQRLMDATCDELTVLGGTSHPLLACRAGCAWCCYLLVSVAAPEALVIAEHLRATLSVDALGVVAARVAALDAMTHALPAQERFNQRRPCALLVDNHCSIYAVRPILCRGWTSYDAAQCELALRQAEDNLPVDHHAEIRQAASEIEQELLAATRAAGLPTRQLELTAALRIALETPDAAERWARGEDVFKEALETPPVERVPQSRARRRTRESSRRRGPSWDAGSDDPLELTFSD
jgi:hypothetical protein